MLLEIAKSFEADVVLCLGIMFKILRLTKRCVNPWLSSEILNILKDTEKLYHDLKRDLPNFVNIMQLPKSPGVQPIGTVRENTRTQLVKLSVSSRLQV